MEFQFPFLLKTIPRPVISLQGRLFRPRPLIPVTVINPQSGLSRTYHGLLDTGADDTVFHTDDAVFHTDDAALLGIDLTHAPTGTARSASGQTVTLRYTEVFLQLANDESEVLEWRATVAFAPKRGTHPLLGFAGFLQFFDTTFLGEHEEVTLIPNGLMPSQTPTTPAR